MFVATLWCTPALAGDVVIDFLDVGQGDSVLIRGGGKSVLIDAGQRDADVAGQIKQLGVRRLDLAVATHAHADHIGGMADVLGQFEVKLFLDSGLTHDTATYERMMARIDERRVQRVRARKDMTIRMGDEAVLHVLWPGESYLRDTRSDLNSNSVVLWLEHGEMDALFTGDAEEPTEDALVLHGIGEVELLKVAHHGSEHSSKMSFLRQVSPEIAVISCGEGNRYGHPDPETLLRLGSLGVLVFRTDTSGHVRAVSNGSEFEVFEGGLSSFTAGGRPRALPGKDTPRIEAPAAPPAGERVPEANEVEPVRTDVPDDVASWLSGVRPTTPVEDEDDAPKKKKKNKKKKKKRQ